MSINSQEKGNWMTTSARLALILALSSCSNNTTNEQADLEDNPNKSTESTNNKLYLPDTEDTDLSRYKGESFTMVSISYTNVEDISSLKGMPIEHIDMTYTLVKDLEALRGNTTLKEIDIRGTKITDLSPIKDAPLEIIYLNKRTVDLFPIKNAILNGAIVHPPTGYRVNRKNWRLEKI